MGAQGVKRVGLDEFASTANAVLPERTRRWENLFFRLGISCDATVQLGGHVVPTSREMFASRLTDLQDRIRGLRASSSHVGICWYRPSARTRHVGQTYVSAV